MITGKTIALTIWIFVGKVMSLLYNMLSRLHSFSYKEQVSFNFMIAVTIHSDFGTQENKVCHYFLISCCGLISISLVISDVEHFPIYLP